MQIGHVFIVALTKVIFYYFTQSLDMNRMDYQVQSLPFFKMVHLRYTMIAIPGADLEGAHPAHAHCSPLYVRPKQIAPPGSV